MTSEVSTRCALHRLDPRIKKAQRLSAKADEIAKRGSAADQLVARELYVEARDMLTAAMREMMKLSPELKAVVARVKRRKKGKAS